MKRYVYVLCLMVAFAGLNSCKKNDDPVPVPVSPVVGKWEAEQIRYSGYTGPYTNLNGDKPYDKKPFTDVFTINSDNTLTGLYTEPGSPPQVYTGTWTFTNNELSQKDGKGNESKYTLETSAQPSKLVTITYPASDSLVNPTTQKKELVKFNRQLVYEKK